MFADRPGSAVNVTRRSCASLRPQRRLDIGQLERSVSRLFGAGLAPSTLRAYQSEYSRYQRFCERAGITPIPTTEQTLCLFVAFLAEEGIAHSTVKDYLSAVRHVHIRHGLGNPFAVSLPRLELVLRGVKRSTAGPRRQQRLPITLEVLSRLRDVWAPRANERGIVMLWAACCLAFFGFLRSGELTVQSVQAFDSSVHLTVSEAAVDSRQNPPLMRVRLKQSKTNPFRQSVDIHLGRTDSALCPITVMLAYLARRGQEAGPLFLASNGTPLSKQRLVTKVRAALEAGGEGGFQPDGYSGHSFRIGAATTAARQGMEDCRIQTLGRWKSDAYKRYVKLDARTIAAYSRTLVAPC